MGQVRRKAKKPVRRQVFIETPHPAPAMPKRRKKSHGNSPKVPELRVEDTRGLTEEGALLGQVELSTAESGDAISSLRRLTSAGIVKLVPKGEERGNEWHDVVLPFESIQRVEPEHAEQKSSGKVDQAMHSLLTHFGWISGGERMEDGEGEEEGLEESPAARLYRMISGEKIPHDHGATPLPNESLIWTALKPYQRRGALWMARQEETSYHSDSACFLMHPLWRAITLPVVDGHSCEGKWEKTIYVNPYNGKLSLQAFSPPRRPFGGILADEMGLGKSLEILALVCARPNAGFVPASETADHPEFAGERCECPCGSASVDEMDLYRPEAMCVQCDVCAAWQHDDCVRWSSKEEREKAILGDRQFVCGRCARWMASKELDGVAKATLVVCPDQIASQWERELSSHLTPGGLSALFYRGQNQAAGGGGIGGVTTAKEIASRDIVVTTYDVLKAELHYEPAEVLDRATRGNSSKRSRRYHVIPTPLTRLTWWRVVMDEAQMVESTATKAAELARMIPAKHRWCVTGTPLNSGLSDLFGLALFLGAKPFDDRPWWRCACEEPAVRGDLRTLIDLFGPFSLRRTREDVQGEINLPPQHELVTKLTLSAIERHFYSQQHQRCAAEAKQKLPSVSSSGEHLHPDHVSDVLRTLARLRQACDHPQVGSGGLAVRGGAVLTMDEVHGKLIERAKIEAEEAQRKLCLCLNGLGGLALIEDDVPTAIAHYREVLQQEEENSTELGLRLDPLQKLHACKNLQPLVTPEPPQGVARTMRDGKLSEEAHRVSEEFLAHYSAKKAAAKADVEKDEEHAVSLGSLEQAWWSKVLKSLGGKDEERLLSRISEELDEEWQGEPMGFRSANGLAYRISLDLGKMHAALNTLLSELRKLDAVADDPSEDDRRRAGQCHQCTADTGMPGVICRHCEIEHLFDDAERVLFGRQRKVQTANRKGLQNSDVGLGRSNPSSAETALRMCATRFAKDSGEARGHLERLELARRQFTHARVWMQSQRALLTAKDELAMAATRDRLREPAECPKKGEPDPVPGPWRQVILFPHEVTPRKEQRTAEAEAHRDELRNAKAQMRFLRRLQSFNSGEQLECPICTEPASKEGGELAVLACGHNFCVQCVLKLVDKQLGPSSSTSSPSPSRANRVKCSMCRTTTRLHDINYVGTSGVGRAVTELEEGSSEPPFHHSLLACEERMSRPSSPSAAYGTKVDAAVRRVLAIMEADPEGGILIFSEWNDVLSVVSAALGKSGVRHERASGSHNLAQRAVERFAAGSSKVLLLPVARGGKGLTLVAARHVILLEPLMDPGAEAQATKRVDRIGQEGPCTVVHRFVVAGTVEERVRELCARRACNRARLPDVASSERKNLTASDVALLIQEPTSCNS